MSNGTSKPRRAMQLGGVFVAVFGLVASITAFASAQSGTTPGGSVEITDEFCINRSLGGPITYAHDSSNPKDGIADVCSLPRTKRAAAARQQAMERMASELALLFGHLFAQECLTVAESFDEPAAERDDECAAPRLAEARGANIPPVPASTQPEIRLDDRSYSGPVITSPSFCINKSFGGPITYPHDVNGDDIYDICSLPRTRRAAVARQNALERMAVDLKPRFDVVFAEECLRVPETLGEPRAEAEDECAVHRAGGTPLPNPDDPTSPDPGTDPGTGTPDDGSQLPYVPAPERPSATAAPTYHARAAQNVALDPGNQQIAVDWDAPREDAGTVFKYIVQWRASGQNWSTTNQAETGIATNDTEHIITGLTNFTTYQIRILAQRGTNDRYTPTLSATPGWSAPPTWPARPLTNPDYGRVIADWEDPPGTAALTINHYIVQWDTNPRFADNNNPFPRDCVRDTTCNEIQTSGNGTTYTINGLTNGTYYVRVQGVTSNGPGVWSTTQRITLASTRLDPGQPTGVMLVTAGTNFNQLTVTWTAPATTSADPAPTDYLVQWRNLTTREAWSSTDRQQKIEGTYTTQGQQVTITTAPLATYTINSLVPRHEYEVRVQAINVDTPGLWSQAVRHVVAKAQPPTAITVDPGDGQLTVSWTAPTGVPTVTSYFLQWATSCSNSAFSTTRQRTVQSATTDTIPNLTNNQRYYIRIQSINSRGSSDWSSCAIGEPGTLDAPTITGIVDSDTNPKALTVTWTYVRATGSDDASKPHLTGFKIRSRRAGSNWSSPIPVALTAKTVSTCNHQTLDETCTYTYTYSNLLTGVSHDFQVLARNSWGDGAWSTLTSGTTDDIPGERFIPTISSVDEDANNIRSLVVNWSAPSVGTTDIAGYRVQYRRAGTANWSTSANPAADATSHTITGLSTGVSYEVRVVARTTFGDGPGSTASTATPGLGFIPTIGSIGPGTNGLQVSWTDVTSYTGNNNTITYTVQYRTCATAVSNCGGWTNATTTATGTPHTIPVERLRHNTYYEARVRAHGTTSGGHGLYSDESSRYLVLISDPNNTPNDRTDDTVG